MQRPTRHSRRGQPLLVLFAIFVIASIATILPVNTAAAGAHERTGCEGTTLVRRLALVDQGDNDRATLDGAIAEAEAIWATAGVRLVWIPTGPGAAPPDAYVVLRGGRRNVVTEAAMMRSGGFRELGWVRYGPDGKRANLVEVSLPAVSATLMNAWYVDKRLRFHPRVVQSHILGRALGRVIAHEVGHWLIGVGHTSDGLMRPILRKHDLMHHESPRLPSSWTDTDASATDSRLAVLRARCE